MYQPHAISPTGECDRLPNRTQPADLPAHVRHSRIPAVLGRAQAETGVPRHGFVRRGFLRRDRGRRRDVPPHGSSRLDSHACRMAVPARLPARHRPSLGLRTHTARNAADGRRGDDGNRSDRCRARGPSLVGRSSRSCRNRAAAGCRGRLVHGPADISSRAGCSGAASAGWSTWSTWWFSR